MEWGFTKNSSVVRWHSLICLNVLAPLMTGFTYLHNGQYGTRPFVKPQEISSDLWPKSLERA